MLKKLDLEDGFWYLQNAWIHKRNSDLPQFQKEMWLPTDITLEKVHDSFAQPETLSFWDLPDFIEDLDKVGFSALRHRLYWHSLLSDSTFTNCYGINSCYIYNKTINKNKFRVFSYWWGLDGLSSLLYLRFNYCFRFQTKYTYCTSSLGSSGICFLLGLAMVFHLEDG